MRFPTETYNKIFHVSETENATGTAIIKPQPQPKKEEKKIIKEETVIEETEAVEENNIEEAAPDVTENEKTEE